MGMGRRDLAHARIGGAFDPFLCERKSGSLWCIPLVFNSQIED